MHMPAVDVLNWAPEHRLALAGLPLFPGPAGAVTQPAPGEVLEQLRRAWSARTSSLAVALAASLCAWLGDAVVGPWNCGGSGIVG